MRKLMALALALACGAAQAQGYPNRPVRVIVAAQTGGPDIVARVVAAELQAQMGQPFVVENQGGANGIVGATTVAKSAPDGYTLLVYSSGFVINPAVHKSLPYDTEKDFTPVTNLVSNGGLFFAVANALPVKSLKEFIDYAKKSPTPLAYSTPGVGNTWHVATEVFNHYAGIKMTHIPYKGGGPAAAALASGEVQVLLSSPAPVMQYAKTGKARVLAYTGKKRAASLPDVPTTAEAGLPTFQVDGGWFGMFAPAKTPRAIIDKLNLETRKALADAAVVKRLQGLGVEPAPMSPEEFAKYLREETAKYADYVRIAGVRLD
jgi:tripartite-type tricarboxylate transporter receptor subunit TctC